MTAVHKRKELVEYLNLIKERNVIERFPNHTIYMWSNFVLNESPDVDLQFVGEVNNDIGYKLQKLRFEMQKIIPTRLDIQMYENTKIFNHIDRFNQCTEATYVFDEEIVRYKTFDPKYSGHNGRKIERLDTWVWKITQIFARKDGKYKNRDWPQPILLTDLL